MTLRESQNLFVENVINLLEYALDLGYEVSFGETYRPQFVQDKYFEEGKTKTRYSQHTKRLAVDLNLFEGDRFLTKTEEYRQLGEYWIQLHERNRWGGNFLNFPDGNHFEMIE